MPGKNYGVTNNINIENAYIMFRNFSGKESKFNPAGRRNFCVRLDDPKLVKQLEADGWNVRYLKAREEGDEDTPYLQVAVSYGKGRPPKITLITSHGQTLLDESTVDTLDWAEIKTADLIINPYNWEVNGKKGVKAYLNALYVTIVEDAFAQKYADMAPRTVAPDVSVSDEDIPF
jgi:hypothetical protein